MTTKAQFSPRECVSLLEHGNHMLEQGNYMNVNSRVGYALVGNALLSQNPTFILH